MESLVVKKHHSHEHPQPIRSSARDPGGDEAISFSGYLYQAIELSRLAINPTLPFPVSPLIRCGASLSLDQ